MEHFPICKVKCVSSIAEERNDHLNKLSFYEFYLSCHHPTITEIILHMDNGENHALVNSSTFFLFSYAFKSNSASLP